MLGQTHKQSSCCLILLPFLHRESIQLVAIQGIVNAQFCHIQTLKTEEEPDHVVRLINTYSIDVESILFELGSYIDLPDVDFSKLAALAQQVEERSSLLSSWFLAFDQDLVCPLSFNWIKNEFAHIRTKLEVIVQMERKIMRLESKHKKKRAYRRRATYGLQTPVHELRPRLGPIDTSSGWQVFGFVLSNLRGNGKMHVDEQDIFFFRSERQTPYLPSLLPCLNIVNAKKMAASLHHAVPKLTITTAARPESRWPSFNSVRCCAPTTTTTTTDAGAHRITVKNGNDSLDICRVLNGMWQTSGGWGRIDRDDAVEAMLRYADAGLSTFDMADHYSLDMCRVVNGMWQTSGGWGKIDRDNAVDAMLKYADAGLTTFDMADIYGPAEDLYGIFINRIRRERPPKSWIGERPYKVGSTAR
ncbi:hypothetical protein NC653_022256 [Populus alba x Populus x berolinensis]|uniref:NADP-dependent oxidoreductase domain-containing protein n=1 Tax=Populus alba x Populus x berolinensis TaxID=444605 RepID=A0AAD6MER8_9ROSI|nr:hypothetical protein NC653_022256 [Populus alba x Populus x berolinensis]